MSISQNRGFNAGAIVKFVVATLLSSLLLSSCGGQTGATESDSPTTQATSPPWSIDDFEDLVEHCDKVFEEPSSDAAGSEIGPIDADCQVIVRQNLDELGCPVEGTYEVIEETRRLIAMDIQFDNEAHSDPEIVDWALLMQAELDAVYARVGCRDSLNLNW